MSPRVSPLQPKIVKLYFIGSGWDNEPNPNLAENASFFNLSKYAASSKQYT